jgi:dihydrofolate reductase
VASPGEAVAGWADRRVWLVGGTALLDGFRAARLVREYHVFVMPVLLGAGVPLFRTGPAASLRLVRVGCLPSGVVEFQYRVADVDPIDEIGSPASS